MATVQPNFKQGPLSPHRRDSNQQSISRDRHQVSPPLSVTVIPRHSHLSFGPAQNSHSSGRISSQDILNKYLDDTGLLEVFNSWTLLLSGLEDLPYNPYPTLAWYARRNAERFHMHEVDEGKLLQIVDGEVYTVGIHIARTIGSPTLWGLYPILKAVNPQYLTKFSWLMTTMTTSLENEDSNDYSFVMHHAITVLVGPCVFYGSIHSEVTSLQFRLEYGIAGPHIDGAATLFAENVHKNIMETEEKSHIVLDITIPVLHMEDEWNTELWKYDDIANNPIGFISSVKTAALNSKKISAKCVFFLDPERRAYQIGQKQYNFNFIRVLQQGTSCLSSLPYLSAFEGVFESHSPVRNYLAWFENVNIPEKPVQFREPTTSNTTRSRGISSLWSRPSKQQRQASGCPSNTTQEGGDLLSASDSSVSLADGPYADEVQNTLRNHFKMMISSLPGEENLFPMLHYIILLLLMDRDNEESLECLLEAMHLVQSSSYKLHLIIEKNFHLQDLIKHFLAKESSDSHLVQSQYLDYRRSIQMLFFNEL